MSRSSALWTPLHADAATHPKVYALANALSIEHAQAFGLLCALWSRALVALPDGRSAHAAQIADLCLWRGSPDALVRGLLECKLLDGPDLGVLTIHGWDEYGGRAVRLRDEKIQRFKGRAGARERLHTATAAATAAATGMATAAAVDSRSRSSSSESSSGGGVGEGPDKRDIRPVWAQRVEPLGMYGPIPSDIGEVWGFQWRGEDVAVHLKRAAPDLDETARWDQTEDCLNYRAALNDREFRQWGWPQGCLPRLISWLERANRTHLDAKTARARAAKAGVYVADTKRSAR